MRMIINFLFAGALLLFSISASAQTTPEISHTDIKVVAIYASKDGRGVNPSLNDLRGKLLRGFGNYSSFEKVSETNLNIKEGGSASANLREIGSNLSISYLSGDSKFVKLQFDIPGKVSTKLKLARGSTFFQAGLTYQNGILILAIEVK